MNNEELQNQVTNLKQQIDELIQKVEKLSTEYSYHAHTNTDGTLQIDPSQGLGGFPITSTVPAYVAPNGTIVLYFSGGTYRAYARINNLWKLVALT